MSQEILLPVVYVHFSLARKQGENVVNTDEDQHVSQPMAYTLESVRSSLPPLSGLSDDFEREFEQVMEEEANRIMQRLNSGTQDDGSYPDI